MKHINSEDTNFFYALGLLAHLCEVGLPLSKKIGYQAIYKF